LTRQTVRGIKPLNRVERWFLGRNLTLLDRLHEHHVYGRRVRVLAHVVARLIPAHARVLDVGCGDGVIDSLILAHRPDVTLEGVDVLARTDAKVPVRSFDGLHLPHRDDALDAVLLIDVLHHARDPEGLLAEVSRVAPLVILKDHVLNGVLAGPTLRFMDWMGNARHGVESPGRYWTEPRWREAIGRAGLRVASWQRRLPLYPWYASWAFGRSLHVLASLERPR